MELAKCTQEFLSTFTELGLSADVQEDVTASVMKLPVICLVKDITPVKMMLTKKSS